MATVNAVNSRGKNGGGLERLLANQLFHLQKKIKIWLLTGFLSLLILLGLLVILVR